MLVIIFLCISGAFSEVEHYRLVSHVDGEKIVKDFTFDEKAGYAIIKQSSGQYNKTNTQLHDFVTGYAAVKSGRCLLTRTIYTVQDMRKLVVAYIQNDDTNVVPSMRLQKSTTLIKDVADIAGDRIAEFCDTLNVYKATPVKKRIGAASRLSRKKCLFLCVRIG